MCGIVGYIGKRDAYPIILNGLKRLEYRGYDSAGIALYDGATTQLCKTKGKVADLEKYPRMLKADIKMLQTLGDKIVVFAPQATDLYGGQVLSKEYDFGSLATEMEGRHRKGHFDGVGTVLHLFFDAIKPDNAYFGKKDFQQLQVVKKLVEIKKLPVNVIGCEIVREPNGVALSSRNKRLSAVQLEEATLIAKTLKEVRENFSKKSIAELNNMVANRFKKNDHLELEYFEIASSKTLKTAANKETNTPYRAFIAAFIGGVRLIDNMALNYDEAASAQM